MAAWATNSDSYCRRAELVGTCLAVPMAPYADEGLPDLVFRAAIENGYLNSSIIARMAGLGPGQVITPYWSALASINLGKMAEVLCTPRGAEDLLPGFYGKSSVSKDSVNFLGAEIRRSSLYGVVRRVAPVFLRSHRYQRAVWSLRILSFDPSTKELLIDRCPSCGTRFTFENTRSFDRCFTCVPQNGPASDIHHLPRREAHIEDDEALQFFASLLDVNKATSARLMPKELLQFDRGQIFEMISSLTNALQSQITGSRRFSSPHVSPRLLISTSRAILEWPSGVRPLLRQLLSDPARELSAFFMRLNSHRFFEPHLVEMLRVEAGEVVSRRPSSRNEHRATNLGSRCDVEDIDIANLTRAMRRSKAISGLSKQIGIALPYMIDLYRQGVLTLTDPVLAAYLGEVKERRNDTLLDRIVAAGQKDCELHYEVSLADGVAAIGGVGANPWPVVFNSILKGRLKVALHRDDRRQLTQRIYVSNLKDLRSALKGQMPAPRLAACPVTKVEVSSLLMNYPVANLTASRHKISLKLGDVASVWAFHDSYIGAGEVQLRLRADNPALIKSDVRRMLRRQGIEDLHVAGRVVYDRASVETFLGQTMLRRLERQFDV